MAILITGGTGFLGAHLARYLLGVDGKTHIVLFDAALNIARVADMADRVTLVRGDVTEPTEVIEAMDRHGVDRVVHLAFLLTTDSEAGPLRAVKVNCAGTANVFEAARLRGARRVVYASSVAAYGHRFSLDDEEHDETTPPVPTSLYGAAKLFIEQLAETYHQQYGLDVIGLRPTSVFGLGRGQRYRVPRQHFMVRPELAALGEPIVMPPDETMTDWIYVKDAAKAWSCALNAPTPEHRVFNMAAERRPIGDYTAHARALLPDASIEVSAEPENSLRLVSARRLKEKLGFEPSFTLEQGLEDYLDEVKAGRERGELG